MILCHYAQIKHTQQVAAHSCSMTGIPTWNLRTWCTAPAQECLVRARIPTGIESVAKNCPKERVPG